MHFLVRKQRVNFSAKNYLVFERSWTRCAHDTCAGQEALPSMTEGRDCSPVDSSRFSWTEHQHSSIH